jgi:hypothetical protein
MGAFFAVRGAKRKGRFGRCFARNATSAWADFFYRGKILL